MRAGWDHCGYQCIDDTHPDGSINADGSLSCWSRGEEEGGARLLRFGSMGALPDNRTDVSGGHWRHRSGSQRPSRGGSEAERRPLWESETAESYNGAESGDVFAPAVSAASTSHGETPEESRARSLSESYRNHAAVRASAAAASSPLVSSPSRVRPHRPLWLNVRSGGSKPTETGHSSKNTIRRRRGVSEDCYVDNNGRGYDWGDSWGKSTRRLAESSTISPATFDPDFDTSRQHLTKLFKSLDTNGSGTVTVEAIQRGLGKLGTYSDINFLLRRADMEKSKEITLEGFIDTVQDYSTKMLADRQTLPVSCFCYDYSPETVSFRWVKTGAEERPMPFVSLRDLVAEKPQDHTQGSVRWVCLTGSNPSLVIYMANRYGIHPLQVEDCLNPTERLKVDAFRAPSKPAGASSNSSNSASKPSGAGASGQDDRNAARSPRPDVSPRGTSGGGDSHPLQSKNDPDRKKAEEALHGEGQAVSSPTLSSRSTIASDDILHVVLDRISFKHSTADKPTVAGASSFEREQVSVFLVGDHTVLFIEPKSSAVSDRISNRIIYAGSKLRLNNARYLVYSLMDSIVDDVFPIMQHFQKWLVELQGKLHSSDDCPSLEVVRAIQQISRDMHMITYYLRPMKMVAIQLITDLPGNDMDLKRHLEDLRDHLLMLEEQAMRMSTWSRSLNKDWVNEQQHRMNQVVYILTMVTSAFMPAQFLSSVFGMNFKFMPELNWRYSYASFWVLVALLALFIFTLYKRHKWL
ncbi:unnamed protein product [Ascophyllum nodosum]